MVPDLEWLEDNPIASTAGKTECVPRCILQLEATTVTSIGDGRLQHYPVECEREISDAGIHLPDGFHKGLAISRRTRSRLCEYVDEGYQNIAVLRHNAGTGHRIWLRAAGEEKDRSRLFGCTALTRTVIGWCLTLWG